MNFNEKKHLHNTKIKYKKYKKIKKKTEKDFFLIKILE